MEKQSPGVCILTSVHTLYDPRIFYKQADSLARAGYRVCLIVPGDQSEPFELSGIRVIPLKRPRSRFGRMFGTVWRVWRQAAKERADVYHFHDPELLIVGLLLRLRGRKVIYDVHEDVAQQIKNKDWVPLRHLVSAMYRLLEMSVCRFFPLVLAEASYEKRYPVKWKKAIVQNFPRLDIFPELAASEEAEAAPPDKHPGAIVYIGGVTRLRGLDVTLEALGMLHREGRSFHFDCIGPVADGYRQELLARCRALGIEDRVTLYGRMKATDAYAIVSQASIGVAVLQPNPNYFESFPTKMFEYMALGIPVITSNFPLYERTIRGASCGLTVDPQRPEDVAAAIRRLMDDPQEARRMGANGRESVETTYNWSVEERKLLQLYRDVLQQNDVRGAS